MDQMKVFADMFVNDLSLKLHARLAEACDTEGIKMKEAALRWLMHHSALGQEDGVILGASSLMQMEENLKACEGGPLPQSIVDSFESMWNEWNTAGKAPRAWV
jgi:aflatoxin B1 aldehyde reductase